MEFSKSLQILLSLANRFPSVTIAAPPIVFVGGVRVGKSSVVEKLIGLRFLPADTNRPLVIKIIGGQEDMYGEFSHIPGRKFALDDVTEQIIFDSKLLKGGAQNLDPMHLKLFVYHSLNLTVVDLPGLPSNADSPLRQCILQHIKPPSTIIVSVTAGDILLKKGPNACKQNSVCLEVDPKGKRTINILTRMDALTDKEAKQLVHLRHKGMMFVQGNKLMSQHREDDPLPNDTPLLIQRCNALSHWYIQAIASRIRTQLAAVQTQVRNLIRLEDIDQDVFVINTLEEFSRRFRQTLDNVPALATTVERQKLSLTGSACIALYFENIFLPTIDALDPHKLIKEFDVRTAIRNMQGASSTFFVPILLVQSIIAPLVETSLGPSCYKCVDDVAKEMMDMIDGCKPQSVESYKDLWEDVKTNVSNLIMENQKTAKKFIEDLIAVEVAHVNIHHPDIYVGLFGVEKSNRKKFKELQARVAERAERASLLNAESDSDSESDSEDEGLAPSIAKGMASSGAGQQQKQKIKPGAPVVPEKKELKDKGAKKLGMFGGHKKKKRHSKVGASVAPEKGSDWEIVKSKSEEDRERWLREEELRRKKEEERERQVQAERETALEVEKEKMSFAVIPEKLELDVKDDKQATLIEDYIENYFSIVLAKFRDEIPKAVMYFVVTETRRSVLSYLIFSLHRLVVIPFSPTGSDREANLQKHRDDLKAIDVMREAIKEIESVRVVSLLKPVGGSGSSASEADLPSVSEPSSPIDFMDDVVEKQVSRGRMSPSQLTHETSNVLSVPSRQRERSRSPSPDRRSSLSARHQSAPPRPPVRSSDSTSSSPASVPSVSPAVPAKRPMSATGGTTKPAPQPQPASRQSTTPTKAAPALPQPTKSVTPPPQPARPQSGSKTPPSKSAPVPEKPSATAKPTTPTGGVGLQPIPVRPTAPQPGAAAASRTNGRRGVPMNQMASSQTAGVQGGPSPASSSNPLFPSSTSSRPVAPVRSGASSPVGGAPGGRGVMSLSAMAQQQGQKSGDPLFGTNGGSAAAAPRTTPPVSSGSSLAPTQKRTLSEQQKIRKAEYEERQRALRAQQMANRGGAPAISAMNLSSAPPSANPLFPTSTAPLVPTPSLTPLVPTPAPIAAKPAAVPDVPPRGDKNARKKTSGGLFKGKKGKKGE